MKLFKRSALTVPYTPLTDWDAIRAREAQASQEASRMTEADGTRERIGRIEAMLELDLIRNGYAVFILTADEKEQRIAELSARIWPKASRARAEHERNPMTHVFDGNRRRQMSPKEVTDAGTDRS